MHKKSLSIIAVVSLIVGNAAYAMESIIITTAALHAVSHIRGAMQPQNCASNNPTKKIAFLTSASSQASNPEPLHDLDKHNSLLNDAHDIVIRAVTNTVCAGAVNGTLEYYGIINDNAPRCLLAVSGSTSTLVDRGLTDFEFIPAKPIAAFLSLQWASHELIKYGSNLVVSTAIKKCIAAFKSDSSTTDSTSSNPITASSSSLASVAAPIVIGTISGILTDAAINYAQPHVRRQLHEFLKDLGENYSKKEEFLEGREGTYAVSNINGEDALNHQHWNPANDTTLPFLDRMCIPNPSYSQSTVPYNQQRSISHTLRCKLYQHESAIIVKETLSNGNLDWCTITSTYESMGTSCNYLLPFGLHRFRSAMTALKNNVLARHITVAGSGLKLNTILEPEPLSPDELRQAIEEYNQQFNK